MEITKNNGILTIKLIDKKIAKEIIIKNHYSHKWNTPFGLYNFGVFRDGKLLGVASYGHMMNTKAKIFTSNNPNGWMIELNRMWIDDTLGMNSETTLIGASLKMLRKIDKNIVAVQSFADGRLGCGTIYKASNFKYYGYLESTFWEDINTGEITHNVPITDISNPNSFIKLNTKLLKGELKPFKVKTYRYIYPFDKSFKFKTPEKHYPEYNKGMEYFTPNIDAEHIKARIKKANEILVERERIKEEKKIMRELLKKVTTAA